MNVLINALSVTNLSGRHVLMGHLRQVTHWSRDKHRFTVLYHSDNADICEDLGPHVAWHECPRCTQSWLPRAAWENAVLPSFASGPHSFDIYFTPSGSSTLHLKIPQVVFCQNPWPLVAMSRKPTEDIKAALQRLAYRHTVGHAAMMIFNSRYMLNAYTNNAGKAPHNAHVAYQALDEETIQSAAAIPVTRKQRQVVSVSAMAPHKGTEIAVRAIDHIHKTSLPEVTLQLVGPWPDMAYRKRIEAMITALGLTDIVTIHGQVSRAALHRFYAESSAFCLMSHCESFGIPAIEAQAFGTPVVSSDCCAIPEICGKGGIYSPPQDVQATAQAISLLLTDSAVWTRYSALARNNSKKYRWDRCSRPLMHMFEVAH